MKTKQGKIVLNDKTTDHGKIRSILREWGYAESDIKRIVRDAPIELVEHFRPQMGRSDPQNLQG